MSDFLYILVPPLYTLKCRNCLTSTEVSPLVYTLADLVWVAFVIVLIIFSHDMFRELGLSDMSRGLLSLVLVGSGIFVGYYIRIYLIMQWGIKGVRRRPS